MSGESSCADWMAKDVSARRSFLGRGGRVMSFPNIASRGARIDRFRVWLRKKGFLFDFHATLPSSCQRTSWSIFGIDMEVLDGTKVCMHMYQIPKNTCNQYLMKRLIWCPNSMQKIIMLIMHYFAPSEAKAYGCKELNKPNMNFELTSRFRKSLSLYPKSSLGNTFCGTFSFLNTLIEESFLQPGNID